MNILDYIPVGYRNAATRRTLAIKTGMTDRQVRKHIQQANEDGATIITAYDGTGYFIPDESSFEDALILQLYLSKEHCRLATQLRKLTGPAQTMERIREAGII